MIKLIEKIATDKDDLGGLLINLLNSKFGIAPIDAEENYKTNLLPHIENLKDELWFLVEYPYVDKVYRDSFYNYYSSKLYSYKRDCIRVSIFSQEIQEDHFRLKKFKRKLESSFLGFFVIRPLTPFSWGRSAISPKALKNNNIIICQTPIGCAVNALKMQVSAFPHSSQDSETITCAETTLWAIMEYFGNRYPEYHPVLPSRIHKVLSGKKTERQVPSLGLFPTDISFALKEFGFGSRIYSEEQFQNDFLSILAIYVESGIPVVVLLENSPINHAVLCVGRETFDHSQLRTAPLETIKIEDGVIFNFKLNSKIDREFVFVDDNLPVYQRASLFKPCSNYTDEKWNKCHISHIVVPLYSKIYLEAFEAKTFILQYTAAFLTTGKTNGLPIYFRIFLASSRSYKDSVATDDFMDSDTKELILDIPMPKFIWIAELSDEKLIKKRLARGLIILDATEANLQNNKPLLLSAFEKEFQTWDERSGVLTKILIDLKSFKIYTKNLQGF
ncbi:hypothetical protein [Algoriphagus pacificus]|uniref:Uncharacterized protein n=1 Tax=Algoriphagus pacificus TaxID=2811234 RepID=A0ABS3CB29_9BACT|nr:hypothetical protein [Algoriphagus pacificus]MBN7814217.1 hypothetical protein [Algoriphagus pacificus]